MSKIHLGVKLKLKVNRDETSKINKYLGCSRFIYNYFLKENNELYKAKNPILNYNNMSAYLPKLKKEFPWLAEVDSTMLQRTCKNLATSYKNFFQGRSECPKFKSKYRGIQSCNIMNSMNNIRINQNNTIKIGKLGNLRLVRFKKQITKLTNLINYKILNATISRESDSNYYVSLCVECEPKAYLPANQDKVAIDLGIKNNYTLSYIQNNIHNYYTYENPKSYAKYEKKLAKLQRSLSKKEKGSKNREKAKKLVSKLHFKIKSIRHDFNHKLSKHLINCFQLITIENLDIESMKLKIGKSVSDLAFHQFKTFLEYKASWYGRILNIVDKYFASSKLCNVCRYKFSNLTISDRNWTCPNCQTYHDRDINAANNLFSAGLIRWSFGITNITTDQYLTYFNTDGISGIYACGEGC